MSDAAPINAGISDSAVNVRVQRIEQLLHTLDPYPFIERDLDHEAEEYIADIAEDLPKNRPLRIVLHLPPEAAASAQAQALRQTIPHFFAERADEIGHELHDLFRTGRRAAVVGVSVLFVCVLLESVVLPAIGWDRIRFLSESLIILGWVANWKPLEIFLYEWWPIVAQRRLYRRLATAEIEIRSM